MAAPTKIQEKSAQSGGNVTSLAATFDTAPTQGNRLIACVSSDATVSTPSGWSVARSQVNEVGLYLFTKVAGSSESSTVTVNPTVSASCELYIAELSPSAVDQVASTSAGSGSTCASGTTGTTAAADEYLIAAFGWNDSGGVRTADSYTNSFTESAELKGAGTTATNLAVAAVTVASTGTQTTTVTLSSSTAAVKSGLIVTFLSAAPPTVAGTTEGGLTAAGTSLAVTLPAGGASTDGYLVIIAKGSVACTINALTGWTEVVDASVAADLAILWYTGTGVPSNPTFTQSASSRSVWGTYRITGTDRATTPTIGTIATGSSTTPNPPSATVTGGPKDILAIACFAGAGELADTDTLVTTFPTNYTDGQIEKTGGTGGTNLAGLLGSAARQITGASSEDPGTFTLGATRAWRAQTIIVYPAATGDVTVVIGRGQATANGRAAQPAETVIPGRGQATTQGRTPAVLETVATGRGQATAQGRNVQAQTSSTATTGRGQATAQGRDVGAISAVIVTVGRGQATAQGRAVTVVSSGTATVTRGQVIAQGRNVGAVSGTIVQVGRGQATAQGRNTSTATSVVLNRGQATAQGRNVGAFSGTTVQVGRGQATTTGRAVTLVSSSTATVTRGQTTARGRVTVPLERVTVTRGQATANGRAVTTFVTVVAAITRGQATAQGHNVQITGATPIGIIDGTTTTATIDTDSGSTNPVDAATHLTATVG